MMWSVSEATLAALERHRRSTAYRAISASVQVSVLLRGARVFMCFLLYVFLRSNAGRRRRQPERRRSGGSWRSPAHRCWAWSALGVDPQERLIEFGGVIGHSASHTVRRPGHGLRVGVHLIGCVAPKCLQPVAGRVEEVD